MIWCKQCCTYIDCRPRAEVMVQDRVNEKMLTASSTVQKISGRLLEERSLTKTEVEIFYRLFGTKLQQYMTDREEATQSRLIDLMQDAIDMTLTSSDPSSADSSTRPSAFDCWTEIRADPTAYMAAMPDWKQSDDDHMQAKHRGRRER